MAALRGPQGISSGYDELPGDGETLLRSGLSLRHMRMIAALDDHGRVSAAAQVMNISQPAASRMISEMEAVLEVKLCERLPRGITLTPYGKALARRARSILLEMREADREISELKAGKGGSVFLGAVTAPAIELAVPAIREIRRLYPRIEITMQVETSNVLARELIATRHDFIIARVPEDLNPRLFESRVIGVEKACLIVRRGHPLSNGHPLNNGKAVRLEDTAAFDWVFQSGGSPLRQAMESNFLNRNIALPDRILNTSSLLLTLVMVAQSDAIAPVSIQVAKFIQNPDGLAGAIDVVQTEFDIEVRPYSLITVKNRVLSPAAKMLHDFILREVG
ncbi:LysR family transcriptional regulator [Mesorhizobium sp. M0761]|uniref:LysR family transcriptional regulator n=1 Tax=unclassified Mesorhizobium TaxID=325217 RepID=UPI0003CEA735|nr:MULTISPECIES: LysR family transcriptional regulator [unclassified Mesorhizobium]ESW70353.1 LysR family transcriptional regulator [Mesorhizobium sp. LSJC277A00]ESX04598.1 LysR family transcriptional regulator [Mesorhizobium sp. LSJC268A00]ESX10691.1 LysR family transcriptional regulator [Mesorhizobium sp. LSJC265A00]ESX96747.1 LysR family transcriptional regulator [Mesorhizobium sp. LNJC403B00]ESY04110.1 LysR family transcriptional regulator [Mesorhizobium sp. LNJC399B00]